MTVVGAYGRDYKTGKQALEDWNQNKDFTVADMSSPWDGKPINKASADAAGEDIVIRFCGLRKLVRVPRK